MSKPNTRVIFSVLLSLIVLVGVFSVVQGAAITAGGRSGQPHVDAGLMPDTSRVRNTGQAAPAFEEYYYDDALQGGGGGCESEGVHPDD